MLRFADRKQKMIILIGLIIIGISGFMAYWLFNYPDTQSLLAWAVDNWDLLFEGRMDEFYSYKYVSLRGADHSSADASSNPLMFIPQMIWCFPVWLAHRSSDNMKVTGIGCIYWYKLLIMLVIILMAWYVYRIVKKLAENEYSAVLAGLLTLAAPEILLSAGYCGQDDIIYLCLLVIAYYCLISNKSRWMLICMISAVTLCPLMIIPVVAMLLLWEKRVMRCALYSVGTLVPTALWGVCSANMACKYDGANSEDFFIRILDYISIPVTGGIASVFVVVMLAVFFMCLVTDKNDQPKGLWLITVMMTAMSFLADNNFYRSMLYIPFLVIMLFVYEGNRELKLLIITVLAYIRFLSILLFFPMAMNTQYTTNANWIVRISQARGVTKYLEFDAMGLKLIEKLPVLEQMLPTLNGMGLALVGILLWITFNQSNEDKCKGLKTVNINVSYLAYSVCFMLYTMIFLVLLFM